MLLEGQVLHISGVVIPMTAFSSGYLSSRDSVFLSHSLVIDLFSSIVLFLLLSSFFPFFIPHFSVADMARSNSVDVVIHRTPYSVQTYIEDVDGRVYFHARRFSLTQYSSNDHFVADALMYEERRICVGGWARKWHH